MKKYLLFLPVCLFILSQQGCSNKAAKKQSAAADVDTQTVADTGFTGIKQFYSKKTLTYEATFKNGVREGLMKSYYPSGKLRQTFWYKNGLKEDTAVWFYEDGKIFRKTPFRRDSMNGVQIQYYRSGAVRAKMEFVNGLRKPWLEEYTSDGKKITDYPTVIIRIKDDYLKNGIYNIYLELDKKNIEVNFQRGEFKDGLFAPRATVNYNVNSYTGFIKLKKSNSPGLDTIRIVSVISTSLGNKQLVYNKVALPYSDLR